MPGNFWTDEEYESAYMVWAYEVNKNLAQTSRETGIPLRTLQYTKKKRGWDERYAAETAEIVGFAFAGGLNELRLGVSAAALQLVKDASDSGLQHSERLASQKLLFALTVHNPDPQHSGFTSLSLIDARRIELNPNTDNSSILAANAIEANLAAARQLQGSRRGPARS